ncbi:MAG: methyltransferase domain-containing protein [Deltaproteobacteria bacterium]|nr:methyltransferase domain-containing protein [Deltaproteobacteria bacterium]
MKQEVKKIEKTYDSLAEEYAETFSGEHKKKPKDEEMLRRFSREIGGRGPVWDLGCGPGQTSHYLKNLGVDISGLDLSEKLLEEARRLHPGIHFRKGNILDLEFADGSMAGAVAFYSIIHFTEEEAGKAFSEVFRVLQPGGTFLLTYHVGEGTIHVKEFLGRNIDMDVMLFTTDFISRRLKDSGFEKIEAVERDPYPGVEYQSRRAYVFAVKPAAQTSL